MGLMQQLEAYREKRLDEFDTAFEQLRQELVDDLARKYRDAGIPAVFRYKTSGRATLEMKVAGGEEFTEALVSGDEKEIGAALSQLLALFVAMRDQNAKAEANEDTE